MLLRIALCCCALLCVALHCVMMVCMALCWFALRCVALHCSCWFRLLLVAHVGCALAESWLYLVVPFKISFGKRTKPNWCRAGLFFPKQGSALARPVGVLTCLV